ncbi:MAG: hypothetical protein ABEH90_10910 [Halolamina sp.]
MAPGPDSPALLAFGAERGMEELRERSAGRNVLAVLTESSADEWHRRWERSTATAEQLALVECYGLARGAATSAPATRVVSNDLAMATVPRPVDSDVLSDVIGRFLDGWESGPTDTLLYVDSLDELLADTGRRELRPLFENVVERGRSGIIVSVDPETEAAGAAVEFGELLTETVGSPVPPAEATAAVRRLREADPTKFGYFRRYWRDALRALERVDRTYPQASQLHGAIETELSPRMLGAALSGLAWLDGVSLRGDTNGANRYDCRSYDPDYAAQLGLAVESLPEE